MYHPPSSSAAVFDSLFSVLQCNVPWLNKSIVQAIRKRNRVYKISKRANNASHMTIDTRAHNLVTAMIRNAKLVLVLVLLTVETCI